MIDLDDVKIIGCRSQWSERLFLEAWHSICEPNAINEHIYIPDIYKAALTNPGSCQSAALLKHLFAFVSHFIAEEGSSIFNRNVLTKKLFTRSQQKFIFLIIIMPDYNYSIFKPHKLCSYSPEPRTEVCCFRLKFKPIEIGLLQTKKTDQSYNRTETTILCVVTSLKI